jgi:hypothetical protein
MTQNLRPCPICKEMVFVMGKDKKNFTMVSCGHKYRFKMSRSQKDLERKYIKTEFGLELK